MKKIMYYCLAIVLLVFCSISFSACCSNNGKTVTVNFIGADERLGLENYTYQVTMQKPTAITFKVPEGYDHTKIVGTIDGSEIESSVEFIDNANDFSERYYYALNKEVSFKISSVKRDFQIDIDLTEMKKRTFDITLDKNLTNCTLVTIPEEKTKTSLLDLNIQDTLLRKSFINQKTTIEYGSYAVLVKSLDDNESNIETLYSNINRFTSSDHIGSMGTTDYSFYNASKKGNSYYRYNSTSSIVFYLGKIQEGMDLYTNIPDYEPDKGFDIERIPNTFNLFTNRIDYKSTLFDFDIYTSSDKVYNSGSDNLDKITENSDGSSKDIVIEKSSQDEKYRNKYNLFKIYIGKNLNNDNLIDNKDKDYLMKDIYIKFNSEIDLQYFEFKLLNYEGDNPRKAFKLPQKFVSDKNSTYVKINYEDMLLFSQRRSIIQGDNEVNYYTGSAILYIELSESYWSYINDGIVRFWMYKTILNTNSQVDQSDLNFVIYMKNGDTRDYGILDYNNQIEFDSPDYPKRNVAFFKFEDIFEDTGVESNNKQIKYKYKKNLYVEVVGERYEDYKDCLIKDVQFYIDDTATTKDPIELSDQHIFNGITDHNFGTEIYRDLVAKTSNSYRIEVRITLAEEVKSPIKPNLSYLNFPVIGDEIGISNNYKACEQQDFTIVHHYNKSQEFPVQVSYVHDLYYYVKSLTNPDFDIELRLDPNDPKTCVSTSKILTDIIGKPQTVEINGEPFYIKVLQQDVIYETLDGNLYIVAKQ